MLPKKYRDIKRDLRVGRSSAGLGLFTNAPIERGGFIIEYTGTILTDKEADEKGGKYLFEVAKNKVIDGSHRGNIARYINHSCKPNAEPEIRRGRVYIFAKRNIKAGEEITYNYGKEYFNDYIKPYGCRCDHCKEVAKKK